MSCKVASPLPSQSRLIELFDYNEADPMRPLVRKVPSGPVKKGEGAGSISARDYVSVVVDKKRYLCHRLVWVMHGNEAIEGRVIDHMNGMDNLIGNLQQITQADNLRRRSGPTGGKSSYRGVGWCKRDKKWTAHLSVNNKTLHFGRFKSETDAAKAHDAGAKEHHGRFAVLNFPS